jgi:ribosomal-protein-alanine N-acetyltransferase
MTPDRLAKIHARAFSATRAWSAAEFSALLQQRGTFCTGDDTSFVLTRVTLDEAEILTLATDPAHRRKGLAASYLARAETEAAQAGARSVFLEVAEDNTAARGLYAAAGYGQVGRRPGYYVPKDAPPVAALILRKDLKPA